MQVPVNELNSTLIAIWSVVAVVGFVLLGWGLRLERRKFAALGKSGQWLWVRIATLPILALTAAAVFYPASAVGGPEALAAFYLLMFTAGPLVYFGLHIVMGWLVRPSLTRKESMGVAATGLAALIGGALFVQFTHPTVYQLALQVKEFQRGMAALRPLPHAILDSRRFSLPDAGEVWSEHWQAPAGVKVTRLEEELAPGQFVRIDDGRPVFLCRNGQDFHVFWPAGDRPPRWRMDWENGAGVSARSEWTSVPATTPAVPFTLQWRDGGFVVPVRLPRSIVSLGSASPDGRESFDSQDKPAPAETFFFDNCLPLEYRNADPGRQATISAVSLRLWVRATQQQIISILRRPAE